MTTIAYKDGVMASDSRLSAKSHIIPGSSQKVFFVAGGLMGVCGDGDEQFLSQELFDALRTPDDIKSVIDNHEVENRDWGLIVVFKDCPDRVYRIDLVNEEGKSESGYYCVTLTGEEGFAVGSGTAYAITAMGLGHSAGSAIEVATRYDSATGGDIIEYEL